LPRKDAAPGKVAANVGVTDANAQTAAVDRNVKNKRFISLPPMLSPQTIELARDPKDS
jgi:hypothetical protein